MSKENEPLGKHENGNDFIAGVRSSALNGFRPDVYISDDLDLLKRIYTSEQIQKIWEDCSPKSSEIIGTPIITGTPK